MTRKTRKGEKENRRKGAVGISLFLLLISFISGCGANENILRSGKETPAPSDAKSEKTPIAKEVEAMRTAGFTFVYVLRRKDGGVIDAADRGVIKLNTDNVNRRVAADDDKAFVLGSNFELPEKNFNALNSRFALENLSVPPEQRVNANVNANK